MDNDGDGSLSPEEFVQAMELPSVQQYLKFLEPWLFCIRSDGLCHDHDSFLPTSVQVDFIVGGKEIESAWGTRW